MRTAPLLLALVLLLPLAGADHVFSHRVLVVGRVVDAEGKPAPGLPVNVTFEGFRATSRCFDSKPEATDPRGDFEVCRHAHALPSDARAVVRVGNVSRTVAVDPDLRHATASLQLDEPARARDLNGEREFQRAVRVSGRTFVLLAAPQEAEGVLVNATPATGNVTVRLVSRDKVLTEAEAAPNEHGSYRVDLEVDALPEGALVRVESGRERAEGTVSPLFRRADLNLVRDLRLAEGPGADAPGSSPTPAPAWVALAALSLAFGVARGRRRG